MSYSVGQVAAFAGVIADERFTATYEAIRPKTSPMTRST